MRWARLFILLAPLVLVISCSSHTSGFTVDETIHLSLGGPQVVTKGNTVQFDVIVENEPGNDKVNWFCSNGSITDRGLYTAPFVQGSVEISVVRKDNGARQSMDVGLMDPPYIVVFRADPEVIRAGEQSTLSFQGYPNRGTITPGNFGINSSAPVIVFPVVTTTYKVTVSNTDGASTSAEATVTVH